MANHLTMDKVQAIQQLRALGRSQRQVAALLRVDRKAVRRHWQPSRSSGTTASLGSDDSKGTEAPLGSEDVAAPPTNVAESPASPAPAIEARGRSRCEAFRALIESMYGHGLSAQRIYQDLVADHGFTGRYWSVRRFVRRLRARHELPFRRMEALPGAEAQVDFGMGARWIDGEGKRHQCYAFRIVLSHSRKAYSEVVARQTTENFIRALENAFQAFGGVPRTLVIDNLRAAVTKADWFDPELNRKVLSFSEHYGTVILPTKPRMPRHKGKIERGIAYVQDNALKGHVFPSLAAENDHLQRWEASVADTRVHGTIKKQVGKLFLEIERPALLPLPAERFPFFHEGQRRVSRDGHIEVAKSYYSLPPEYMTRDVWVRWDSHTVRVFNHRWEQITLHARAEMGRFSTHAGHIASEKITGVERGAAYLLQKIQCIGLEAVRWSESMLAQRGISGVRVLQGLLGLSRKHSSREINDACETAWRSQAYRLRVIRQLITRRETHQQQTMEFINEHPLIRPLADYSAFVHQAIQGENSVCPPV